MMGRIGVALFALGVVLAGSLDYPDSQVFHRDLVLRWANGESERVPATNRETCNAAVRPDGAHPL